MTPNTKKQISNLNIDPTLPLMIFDADEVLVHFAEPFAAYIKKYDHRLHLTGYRLDNAIKKADTDEVADPDTADKKSSPVIDRSIAIIKKINKKVNIKMITELIKLSEIF